MSRVKRFTKWVAMLLLVVLGLATEHCGLERVTGFEFLAWCHPADPAPHQDNGCEGDACSVIESGFYRIEEQPAAVPMPVFVLAFELPAWDAAPPKSAPQLEALILSPPELARAWQFFHRTAQPPRAPSLVA